jgi:hypothetical protein
VSAEDVLVETESVSGLRQVNAPAGALSAYQFYGRPFSLALKLRRIEPVVNVSDRVTLRMEESRLMVTHALVLNVEKAGIYSLELLPQTGFVVADVRGDNVEDWKVRDGKLQVSFSSRALGNRSLTVQLEQALKTFLESVTVTTLRVVGAAKESAQIGASSAAGIQIKTITDGLTGVREIPVNRLPSRSDESLAFTTEQSDWKLTLATQRMSARVTADVFNLLTVGDGLVGGSATIRYAILHQGVQEFRVKIPAHWKNVDFTGPIIRRKEQQGEVWVIGLQEKAWGGYTLVVTYDFGFDPHKAMLPVSGAHAVDVERETGSIAVTSAANLQLRVGDVKEPLRRIDESELAQTDRALITRPVLIAYRYTGDEFALPLEVTRFEEQRVLDAVADRTQLTTVLTEQGQMLTQASFMVKNNDRQFQTFTLPAGADFWACYVNNQPAKPERNGNKLMVPLPRGLNRDQAFAVDIVYAQKIGALPSWMPKPVALVAPATDMQTTYAEWELYVPRTHQLGSFGGNMIVARGTTHGLRDAWREFIRFYDRVLRHFWPVFFGVLVLLVVSWFLAVAIRRGWRGALSVIGVFAILIVLAGMLLPAMSRARESGRRVTSVNHLKQIGLALSQFASENNNRLPARLEELVPRYLPDTRVLIDPQTGENFEYYGPNKAWHGGQSEVLAAQPGGREGRSALFGDGRVEYLREDAFQESQSALGLEKRDWGIINGGLLPNKPAARAPAPVATPEMSEPRTETGARERIVHAGGAGIGFGPSADASVVNVGGAVMPMVAGIRPIRVEIPRQGQRYVFTKVLNVGQEPLAVKSLAMEAGAFKAMRGGGQAAALLAGLALLWWQLRRKNTSALLVAVGVALVVGSVTALLLSARLLDEALIMFTPIVALAVLVAVLRKFWPKRQEKPVTLSPAPPPIAPSDPTGTGGTPPAITALILVSFLMLASPAEAGLWSWLFSSKTAEDQLRVRVATYEATVTELDAREARWAARVDATLELTGGKEGDRLALFGEDVAVQEFSASPADVKLLRDDKTLSVMLGRSGPATVRVKFLVKLTGDVSKRSLMFKIPAALSSQLRVTIDELEAAVEAPTAVSFKTSADNQKTRLDAVYGATDGVELSWTPRVKRAADVTATVFCQNTSLVNFAGGAVTVRTILNYQVTQGELRQLRVKLPDTQRLMRVEGDQIRTWKVSADGGEQILTVELVKGVTPAYRLTVETEKLMEAAPVTVSVETAHAMDVKRETGLVALKSAEELSPSVEKAAELQKVDVEEFTRVMTAKSGAEGVSSAYRFFRPDFKFVVRVETVKPQVEATVRHHARVSTEQLSVTSTVDYTIKRAGVFALRLALPAGYRVERVTGQKIAQWVEKPGAQAGEPATLEVTLKERTIGTYNLRVDMTQLLREMPRMVTAVGAHPLGAGKLGGYVVVSSEEGVQVKGETFEDMTEAPVSVAASDLAGQPGGSVLAYKLIPSEGAETRPDWKLTVSTERLESWVRAEVMNWVTATDTLVSGRSVVRFEIQNAPAKEFRVKVPAEFKNVDVNGANIRRRDQVGDEWRVELQNKVRGTYALTVTWELPWKAKDGVLTLHGVEAPGVERETGVVAITAKAPLQVSAREANSDLIRIDARETPAWAERPTEQPALVYRYLRPGYTLNVGAQRFEEAEVLQALVDSMKLTSVVSEDGQMMTEMALEVRNNARQYLEVKLPDGSEVWSAFVAGEPVRPSLRDGKLLLPMERSSSDTANVTVEVIYVGSVTFPKKRGQVELMTPALDVPLKNARWDLFLPPDFEYRELKGSMTPTVMKTDTTVAQDRQAQTKSYTYSLGDYEQAEDINRSKRQSEVQTLFKSVRGNLSSGKLKEANEYYSRVQGNQDYNERDNDELKKLEKELRQAQVSNLVMAQGQVIQMNAAAQSGALALDDQVQQRAAIQYDAKSAEQQWDKLQQAQEVAVAKVLPLRVNLPRRGVPQLFTQVLQTETGRPMTVKLMAQEARGFHWMTQVAGGAAGFVLLWLAVAGLLNRSGKV